MSTYYYDKLWKGLCRKAAFSKLWSLSYEVRIPKLRKYFKYETVSVTLRCTLISAMKDQLCFIEEYTWSAAKIITSRWKYCGVI